MSAFSWFWDLLAYFGWHRKSAKILFLGLDNAGKTTLLHMLKDDVLVQHTPTMQPNMEELTIGNMQFQAWDLGGHQQARVIWESYFAEVDALVFIVDGTDVERFPEAAEQLQKLLMIEELREVPFLVLGNKIDLSACVSEQALRSYLGLNVTSGQHDGSRIAGVRPMELFMCSVVRRFGYHEAFSWLNRYL